MQGYTFRRITSSVLFQYSFCAAEAGPGDQNHVKAEHRQCLLELPSEWLVSRESVTSFPSLPCYPCGLQLCPTPHTHCTICHPPPCIKIPENERLCSRLPPCTVPVTSQEGNLDTSTSEVANQDTVFTMLHLCHSHYTVHVTHISVTLFWICNITNIFSVHLCKDD